MSFIGFMSQSEPVHGFGIDTFVHVILEAWSQRLEVGETAGQARERVDVAVRSEPVLRARGRVRKGSLPGDVVGGGYLVGKDRSATSRCAAVYQPVACHCLCCEWIEGGSAFAEICESKRLACSAAARRPANERSPWSGANDIRAHAFAMPPCCILECCNLTSVTPCAAASPSASVASEAAFKTSAVVRCAAFFPASIMPEAIFTALPVRRLVNPSSLSEGCRVGVTLEAILRERQQALASTPRHLRSRPATSPLDVCTLLPKW